MAGMDTTTAKLIELGFTLPAPLQVPAGARLPFVSVNVVGSRAIISGHGPLDLQGKITAPFGKVGAQVSIEEATHAAQLTALAMLSSLKQTLGSLDRVTRWVKLLGMVNAAPGFTQMPQVINGASDLILAVYGSTRGAHARSAIGVAELPWNIPVELEAEVEIDA
jgi:enamine deaminase RidA (YjgF/YER057c/UK114 family)